MKRSGRGVIPFPRGDWERHANGLEAVLDEGTLRTQREPGPASTRARGSTRTHAVFSAETAASPWIGSK